MILFCFISQSLYDWTHQCWFFISLLFLFNWSEQFNSEEIGYLIQQDQRISSGLVLWACWWEEWYCHWNGSFPIGRIDLVWKSNTFPSFKYLQCRNWSLHQHQCDGSILEWCEEWSSKTKTSSCWESTSLKEPHWKEEYWWNSHICTLVSRLISIFLCLCFIWTTLIVLIVEFILIFHQLFIIWFLYHSLSSLKTHRSFPFISIDRRYFNLDQRSCSIVVETNPSFRSIDF